MAEENQTEQSEAVRIAHRLRFAFINMGLDPLIAEQRDELAALLRVNSAEIVAWVGGELTPALWQVAEIARHSGLSVLWILAEQGPVNAEKIHEGLILKTDNDELVGMATPLSSNTAGALLSLANEVNAAISKEVLSSELESHILQTALSLRAVVKAQG